MSTYDIYNIITRVNNREEESVEHAYTTSKMIT